MYQVEHIAQVCHEANRALQIINGDPVSPLWGDLDEETRNSAIDGVVKSLEGATAKEMHENWVKFKVQHGWTYGEAKNDAEKTHPCLVAYEDLPAEQQIKDSLFSAIVRALTVGPAEH